MDQYCEIDGVIVDDNYAATEDDEYSYPPEHGPARYLLTLDGEEPYLVTFAEFLSDNRELSTAELDAIRLLAPGDTHGLVGEWTIARLAQSSPSDIRVLSTAAFFEGEPDVLSDRVRSVLVSLGGVIRAWDDVAGCYTILHSISDAEGARIRAAASHERKLRAPGRA